MPRLTGTDAITYAALTATQLDSYTPPVAQPRDDLTTEQAEKVVHDDGGFVWTDTSARADTVLGGLSADEASLRLTAAGHPQNVNTILSVLDAARGRSK